jgi:tripartite-type tricarboxylate transporter receptor subunit TctC
MSSTGIMSINQFLYANMNFDPNGSLTPITMVADMPMLLVVRKSLPVRNLNEFIQLAKNQELFYGSPGNGTTGHLGMEFFTHATGLKLQHVPYKSAAEAVQAALSGQTSTMFDNPPSILAQIQSGELRAIGIASMERIGILPDVPTLNESGLSNFEANSWFGLVGPSKTPKIIIERIQQETSKVLKDPELLKKFNALGARLVGNTPTEFNQIINNDRIRWEKVIKSAGVKIQ